jgi:fumarate hydratase class II
MSGYASQMEHAIARVEGLEPHLAELALGGTAVGTGINSHPEFAGRTIRRLAEETGLPLREAANHFAAQGAIDACVETAATLKGVAITLIKIANDIRLLASGPRCGLGELRLSATQPGSSIMPGKVNPVMCEMAIQAAAQVIGHEATVAFCGTFGFLELNTMLPLVGYDLLQMIELLSNAARTFTERCVSGLEADVEKCAAELERSLSSCTALVPAVGYDVAARIAHEAYTTGKTIREVAKARAGLDPAMLERLLEPRNQLGPA